jgi:hypothetical protein
LKKARVAKRKKKLARSLRLDAAHEELGEVK